MDAVTETRKDPYMERLLDKVFPSFSSSSMQACASSDIRQVLGLHNLPHYIENETESKVSQDCQDLPGSTESSQYTLQTDGGRIGFGVVEFDVSSNVGTMLIDADRLGLTSYSNFSTARANCCVYKGKWMYELMLGSKGVMQHGWCTLNCKFSFEEGVGDTANSYAYDGSRRRKWNVKTHKYGQQWLTGDVITCALDCDEGTATFYRNGQSMGMAFRNIQLGSGMAYFPAVSLSQFETLTANFGATPLRYPIPGYRPLQDPPCCDLVKAELLLGYLDNLHREMQDENQAEVISDKDSGSRPVLEDKFRSRKCTNMLVAAHIFDKLAPLLRTPYVVEACLIPFLLKLSENSEKNYSKENPNITNLLDNMWSLMQEHEIKACFENLFVSLLQCYRFSSVTEDFSSAKRYLTLTLHLLQHHLTRRHVLINVIFEKVKFPLFMHIKAPDSNGLDQLIPTVYWDRYEKQDEDKPMPPKTTEEKIRQLKFVEACEQLRKKIEDIEEIQTEMLKILLIHTDSLEAQTSRQIFMEKFCIFLREYSGLGRANMTQQIAAYPLPVMLCFFHRMAKVVRFYWDNFQKEFPERFVSSADAYVPIHQFWSETRMCVELQRCGGLVSHINRLLGAEVNKAQGIELQTGGKVTSSASKKSNTETGSYPDLDMPSGNSLMTMLDGLVLLYHVAAHKQLAKMCTLRDNMKEYVTSLEDTEQKLQSCPEQLDEVRTELERSRSVFLEKVSEYGRQIGWVVAAIYSPRKQDDIAWLFGVVLRSIDKASQYRLLFQYVPEFYIECAINIHNCLKNFFHPTCPFHHIENHEDLSQKFALFLTRHFADSRIVNTDIRDNIVQALACFTCYPASLKVLEGLPLKCKEDMMKSLILPYENRSWAQTNWILVRIWKGCGFGFRYTHLPHLVPSKVQPTEFGFASLQKPCPSQLFQKLLRDVLLQDKEAATRFIDTVLNQVNWSFSEFIGMMQEIQQRVSRTEFRILESRQLKICATCFEIAVCLLRVLEMLVNITPEIFVDLSQPSAELLLGRVIQLLCQVLNRVTTKDGMFDTVVNMFIQGLESVSHFAILGVTVGIMVQLLLRSPEEGQNRAIQLLLTDVGFQLSSLEFLLKKDETSPIPTDKYKVFSFLKYDEVSPEEIDSVKQLIALIENKQKNFSKQEEDISDDELCTICYANSRSAIFLPCRHQSCRTCISLQMMRKKECFFCKVIITSVIDLDGKPIIKNPAAGSNRS